MGSKLLLKPDDYARIDRYVNLQPGEHYTVVTHRIRGKFRRSIHVFAREPNQAELTAFEDTSSKVRVRGRRTEFEGSQAKAFAHLYDTLILRAYDVPNGFSIVGEINLDEHDNPIPDPKTGRVGLNKEEAIRQVGLVTKREALRDAVSEVYSEGRLAEMEGEDDEVDDKSKEGDRRSATDAAPVGAPARPVPVAAE